MGSGSDYLVIKKRDINNLAGSITPPPHCQIADK